MVPAYSIQGSATAPVICRQEGPAKVPGKIWTHARQVVKSNLSVSSADIPAAPQACAASYFLHTPNAERPEDGTAKTVLTSHGLPGIEESPHDHNPHNVAASSRGAKEFKFGML